MDVKKDYDAGLSGFDGTRYLMKRILLLARKNSLNLVTYASVRERKRPENQYH